MKPTLNTLRIGELPERWRALGFSIADDARLALGEVTLRLEADAPGITGWSLPAIDGLPTCDEDRDPAPADHPNGALSLDHVVVLTPAFDRTAAAFADAGLPFRRTRDAGGFRQGFRRCGPAIVEVVEAVQLPAGPARFWGLVPVVADLDALRELLGPELLSEPKPAVQPGRRIATVRRAAGLSCAVAFITPEP
jgi:hypothetical protein